MLAALALASVHALMVPAFWPVDELANVGYARLLLDGDLPTIDTPTPDDGIPGLQGRLFYERVKGHTQRMDAWTSNHPPLYYLLAGVPLALGVAVDLPEAGLLVARLVAVAATGLGVLATALLADVLVPAASPRRRAIVVGAALLAALTPGLAHVGGLVFNDTLAFALATLALAAGLRVLREGPVRPWPLIAAAAGAAAAATRVATLPAVALAAGACALGAWVAAAPPGTRALPARLRAAAGEGLLVVGAAGLAAGWFYARNVALYGDLTGSAALFDKFGRSADDPVGGPKTLLGLALDQWDRLLGDLTTGYWVGGPRAWVGRGVLLALLLGIGLALLRALRGGGRAPRDWAGLATPAAWGFAALLALATLLANARFHDAGGSPHGRYLLVTLGVIAVAGAGGLAHLPGGRRGWLLRVVAAALVALNLGLLLLLVTAADEPFTIGRQVYELPRIWPDGGTVVASALLVVWLAAVARALSSLRKHRGR